MAYIHPFPYYDELRAEAQRTMELIDIQGLYNRLTNLEANSEAQRTTYALIKHHTLVENNTTFADLPYQSNRMPAGKGVFFSHGLPQTLNFIIELHLRRITKA